MKEGRVIGLGLESSCDETAAAVVADGREILSNCIYSQVDLHALYSGVVPEIASRAHLEKINPLIHSALEEAGVSFSDLDYVAATNRPGLIGSLMIALQSAKTISFTLKIPLVAVNHLEAHMYAPFLEGYDPGYPFIGLLISGGNTVLYEVSGPGKLQVIGRTADDAVGESYDKVSKFLGFGYPGGPVIDNLAKTACVRKNLFPKILTDPGDTRFSYSGLKTAVINYMKQNPGADTAEVAWSFQERALEILSRRLFASARSRGIKKMVVAGGVAANSRLRELLADQKQPDETIMIPSPLLCTDNAAMVAGAGYMYYRSGLSDPLTVDVKAKV
ncbi:MAG TPA: tRNA (adenosine(37)-N6)-threonylcarbamoyltransferase complex transferase subunit TsaD [Spirochaetota bacterium]|nr:tRNA (adenosine(37)-N6)-threonylcarbamoyltransferase complex transferase subunit TsaD [Spirochaetota bacterium]